MKFCDPTSKYSSAVLKSSHVLRVVEKPERLELARAAETGVLHADHLAAAEVGDDRAVVAAWNRQHGGGDAAARGQRTTVSGPLPRPSRRLTLNVTGIGITCSGAPM